MIINFGDIATVIGSLLGFGLILFLCIVGFKQNSKKKDKNTKNGQIDNRK